MNGKTRVGVIFGGRSGEHEVSLRSARSVIDAFDADRYEIVPIGINKQGRWLLKNQASLLLTGPGDRPETALVRSGPHDLVPSGESLRDLDVIFPVLHGPMGEDGTVQGLLELAGLAYVGCGVAASALAMDKAISKRIFAAHDLPQLPYIVIKRRDWRNDPRLALERVENHLSYPVFVKPANMGSSVGIGKASDRPGLARALEEAALYDRKLVIEQGIDAREIEVSVLGNDEPVASLPGEIVPCHEFYDYAAKYIEPDSELLIPAPISPEQTETVQRLAVEAFLALDGAGLARVDFLLDRQSGDLYLNEVNTMPGFTSISMYPKLWEASGLPYPDLLDRLVELALERSTDKAASATSYVHQDHD